MTLLFADIVGFTRLSSVMSAHELVEVLGQVFTAFDQLTDLHGLEKIKTIGDAYMVVGGLTDLADDHTARMAAMVLELSGAVDAIHDAARLGISFRIGMHCGPVVAGVIGTRKFIYDVWGDAVNVASRMESLGVPGRVQVTDAVVKRPGDAFDYEPRRILDVKGKSRIPAYLLVRHRAVDAAPGASPRG